MQLRLAYEAFFADPQVRLYPADDTIVREPARLRAAVPALRTPDAVHAATALRSGCTLFLTNDIKLGHVPNLPVTVLDNVLNAP